MKVIVDRSAATRPQTARAWQSLTKEFSRVKFVIIYIYKYYIAVPRKHLFWLPYTAENSHHLIDHRSNVRTDSPNSNGLSLRFRSFSLVPLSQICFQVMGRSYNTGEVKAIWKRIQSSARYKFNNKPD
jgi:hypothetical protein